MRGLLRKDQLEAAIVKTTRMLANKSITVTQRGSGAYCKFNPKTGEVIAINLPMLPDAPTESFMDALQGFLDHEVAHALYTNAMVAEAQMVASELNTGPQAKAALHMFSNIIEDVRIEAKVPTEFPGAEANLNKLRQHIIDTVWRPDFHAQTAAMAAGNPQAEAIRKGNSLIPFLRGLAGQALCADLSKELGLDAIHAPLLAAIPDLQKRLTTMTSSADAVSLAELIMKVNAPPPPESEKGEDPEEENDTPPPPSNSDDKGEDTDGDDQDADADDQGDQADADKQDDEDGEGADDQDADADEDGESKDTDGDDGEDGEKDGEGSGESEDEADHSGEENDDEADGGQGDGPEGDDDDAEDGEEGEGGKSPDDHDGEHEDNADDDAGDGDEEGGSGGAGGDQDQSDESLDTDAESDSDGGSEQEEQGEGEDTDGDDSDEAGKPGVGCDLGMDLSEAKDIDGMLDDELKGMMNGAFDDKRQVDFTCEWDKVEPYDDSQGRDPNVKAIEDRLRPTIQPMQKEIQRLIVARSHAVMIPGFRRGRINSTALHRVPCGDDRVFRKKQEAVTNKVAVTLLIDNSGSMAGGKIETAMKAAWAFAETLDRLKIPCDVLGFTNCGFPAGFDRYTARDEIDKMIDDTGINPRCLRLNPTYIPIYKGFDEKFGPAQKRRMAHLIENQGILSANNDAKALEYAGARLHQRTETRKIMIVFSDGQPADAVDDRILKATTKANVKRLEHEGVEVIGIGIQTDAVKDYYAKHHVLNDVTDLPVFVMQQLKGLLAPKH